MTLLQKLLTIQKSLNFMKKNAQGFNYKYVKGVDLLGIVRPMMDDLGILLLMDVTQTEVRVVETKSKNEVVYIPSYKMRWIDTDTGEELTCGHSSGGSNNLEQGIGSAHTYAERYFLLKFFHIPTDELDPDFLQKKREAEKIVSKPQVNIEAKKETPKYTKEVSHTIPSHNPIIDNFEKVGEPKKSVAIITSCEDKTTKTGKDCKVITMSHIWGDMEEQSVQIWLNLPSITSSILNACGKSTIEACVGVSFQCNVKANGRFYNIDGIEECI